MMHDFLVLYPVNPKALARYREAFRTSGAKDDPADSGLLLDLVSGDQHDANVVCKRVDEFRRSLFRNVPAGVLIE
ncbi:MAG TPA: hypothetical protein VER98_03390, partial [Terriglobia bacterium]|nr:hypothetical protein [Terriglobia bacterium]